MFEKKKEEKELIKRLDKINYTLSQNNILELIELLGMELSKALVQE